MRVGFACLWDPDPRTTWSGTPWSLLQALQRECEVVDLGPHISSTARHALRAAYVRPEGRRLVSPWKHGRIRDWLCERSLTRSTADNQIDAVVQVQDLCVLALPFWLVQDLSYDVLLELSEEELDLQFPGMSSRWIERRRARQREVYERATGLFPMSEWLARQLIDRSAVPAERVTVVRPGANTVSSVSGPRSVHEGPPRLLFVGRDFVRKGGDLVVEAVRLLRADYDPALRLTVCGPPTWPLEEPPGEGVSFVGALPRNEVDALYERHDVLVLPSRFEAFGIVFLEALAHGVPCVARDAYAMPEVVRPGLTGELVDSDDASDVARGIVAVLENHSMREQVAADRERTAREYSWERAAGQISETIARSLG